MGARRRRGRAYQRQPDRFDKNGFEFTGDVARVLASAHADGYHQGFIDGREVSQREFAIQRDMIMYQARLEAQRSGEVERARMRGYEQGFAAGKCSGATEVHGAAVDKSKMLKDFLSKAHEACRVISESNPNMAPGVNAVKRQISKIKLD